MICDRCSIVCQFAGEPGDCKGVGVCNEKKTNADRIRSMTDEELVKQFAVEMGFCCPVKGVDCSLEPDCRVCFARWLKQEADE